MYLMWFDDNAKRTPAEKVTAAVDAYVAHFRVRPNVALVNAEEIAPGPDGVAVRAASYVRKHNYWIGFEVQP